MNIRYLAGVRDLPYCTPDGDIVSRAGWNEKTGLYLRTPIDYAPQIPDEPTLDDVERALKVIAEPWSAYRFASPDCAAGMLSAIFAAVNRQVMSMCPAYMLDASQQGSGKTKAASALGALIVGRVPAVTAWVVGGDDELRKRLVSEASEGVPFSCIDNMVGYLKSPTLAAVLTTGRLRDRILGRSETIEANVRALLTFTANNCSLDADLQRRTVQVRIDAGDSPTHRQFEFDPVTLALASRVRVAEAVCVVLRAYFVAGAPDIINGDAGGFADWNRLARQPVLWLAAEGFALSLPWGELGDPAGTMLADAGNADPEVMAFGDLLRALWALSEGKSFAAQQVREWRDAGIGDPGSPQGAVRDGLLDLTGKDTLTAASIGRVLSNRRDRAVNRLKLISTRQDGSSYWRVVSTQAATP